MKNLILGLIVIILSSCYKSEINDFEWVADNPMENEQDDLVELINVYEDQVASNAPFFTYFNISKNISDLPDPSRFTHIVLIRNGVVKQTKTINNNVFSDPYANTGVEYTYRFGLILDDNEDVIFWKSPTFTYTLQQ
jgi:hypothetical protein